MLSLSDFINKYTGVITGNTPENTGQCVGLVSVWMDNLGIPHEYGNAKDLLTNADLNYFDVIANTPDDFPLPSDIIVWNENMGRGFGHTAICVTADKNSFTCFEQNNPDGSTPHIGTHDYTNVLGWLHLKASVSPCSDLQQELDTCRVDRDQHWNDLVSAKSTIDSLNKTISEDANSIAILNGKLNALETQLTTAQQSIDHLTPIAQQVPSLQKLLTQANSDKATCSNSLISASRTITQLRNQLAASKPVGFWNKLKFILS